MDLSKVEWRKATRSLNNGGECVEVADLARATAVRDNNNNPDGPSSR